MYTAVMLPDDHRHRKPRGSFSIWLLLLVVVNLIARLPLYWDPATVDNDGAEYLAITRHLCTTGEYATDLKWQFFTDDPVRHLAWADRPPLYPYLALLCQRALPFLDPIAAARVGNAVLACAALVLCAVYLRRVFGERIALFATGFVFLLPHTLKWTTQPMTETVTLALTFGTLLIWDRIQFPTCSGPPAGKTDNSAHESPRSTAVWGGIVLCGALAGLAYLARPSGALLLATLAGDAWLARRGNIRNGCPGGHHGRHRLPVFRTLLSLAFGFALVAAPYHGLLWGLYGNPFHSALGFTFAVKTYYEVSYYGFEAVKPTPAEFFRRHWFSVPGLVLHQVWRHVQILVPQLLPFLPFAYWLRREDLEERRRPALGVILGTFLIHTVTWSAWGSSRYFLPCLPLIVAFLLTATERCHTPGLAPIGWRRLAGVMPAGASLGLLLCLTSFYITYARPDRGLSSLPAWREAAQVIQGAQLVASDKPSILNLLRSVPAIRLPRTTDTQQLNRFIHAYHPDVLVLFADEPAECSMAAAWRAGRLPEGWYLALDHGTLLVARPQTEPGSSDQPVNRTAPGTPQTSQARPARMVN